MNNLDRISRRGLLGTSLVLAPAALVATLSPSGKALADALCALTSPQGEGPFYPTRFGKPGNDLFLAGAGGKLPDGDPIIVSGKVTDAKCRPAAGVVVEIWQADRRGRYQHPSGQSGPRDPHFAYWGMALTDANGAYRFRTIFPGAYGSGSFQRTPHIHVKVRNKGRTVLTTQMYFPGHPRNSRDFLFNGVPSGERHTVIAVEERGSGTGAPTPFRFDIAVS
ncbi:MAG: protocatechuate 3,4-dioxygenase [bacterium]